MRASFWSPALNYLFDKVDMVEVETQETIRGESHQGGDGLVASGAIEGIEKTGVGGIGRQTVV